MAYQMIIQDIVATKLRARCQYDIKYPAPTDIMTILIRAKESDFPDYTISRSEESFSILGRVVYVTNKI